MVELAGTHGYEAVTVRGVVALAGVSTATFYKHFPNVEACFFSTYDAWTSRLLGRAKAAEVARVEGAGLDDSLRSLFTDFARNPKEARLVLVEVSAVGDAARPRISRTTTALAKLIAGGLHRSQPQPPALRFEGGVAAAVTRTARTLISGELSQDPGPLADTLARWVRVAMSRQNEAVPGSFGAVADSATERDSLLRKLEAATDDRSRLHSAVARLSLATGAGHLTISQVCSQANVPRSTFCRNFANPIQCLLDLSTEILSKTVARAWRDGGLDRFPEARGRSIAEAVHHDLALNPALAELCWAQLPAQGRDGLAETDRLISTAAGALVSRAPTGDGDRVTAEASLAAMWAILRTLVEERSFDELDELSLFIDELLQTRK
jgi:AcrR family transcriptional regulator